MIRTIELTQGQVAIVSDEDYSYLMQWKWCASLVLGYGGGGKFLALRSTKRNEPHMTTLMHRMVLMRMLGRDLKRSELTDHIDGNPLNNTRENLRLATYAENNRNRKKQTLNTSGYKGVSFNKPVMKWNAKIRIDGRLTDLGLYTTPELAAHAYDERARELFGEYARLNFPREGERAA